MIQYSYENIIALDKYNRYTISEDVSNLIDKYTLMVSSPSYNKSPHFLIKKSIILDDSRDKIGILNDTIKKILNKIAEKNYDKLIIELINNVNSIFLESNGDREIIDNTVTLIFNNFFVSNINTELNVRICYALLDKFDFIDRHLSYFINKIKDLHNELKVCNSISFDELEKVNKNNSIIRNKIKFYCRLRKDSISTNDINLNILHFQNILDNMLCKPLSKMECDEMAELLLVFLNEKGCLDLNDELEKKIYENIIGIVNSNTMEKNNLSNKIILKHKNILTKMNL